MGKIAAPIEMGFLHKNRNYEAICEFLCGCGNLFTAVRSNVRSGNTKSCGCVKTAARYDTKYTVTHGQTGTPTYKSWDSLKARCLNPNTDSYKNYGGRGISVCDRWLKFENFLEDMGERPSKDYSINRIDNDGDYEPGNCEWILKSENSKEMLNRRYKNK